MEGFTVSNGSVIEADGLSEDEQHDLRQTVQVIREIEKDEEA